MTTSIVIRTKNEERYIGRLLHALHEQVWNGSCEIVIVDSGSSDRTVDVARECGVEKILHIPPEQFSFGYALNHGIQHSSGKIVCCLSAHCLPLNETWLFELIAPIEESGAHATYGRQVPIRGMNPFEELSFSKHFPEDEKKHGRTPFSNANCAFLRSMWERMKFDEDIPSWEDALWHHLLKDDYKFRYCPKAAAYHTHAFSLKAVTRRAYNDGRAFRVFKERYGIDLVDSAYPNASAKLKLFFGDFMRHARFFWKEGYLKELFLIPVVRSLTFKAYRDGYKSIK